MSAPTPPKRNTEVSSWGGVVLLLIVSSHNEFITKYIVNIFQNLARLVGVPCT